MLGEKITSQQSLIEPESLDINQIEEVFGLPIEFIKMDDFSAATIDLSGMPGKSIGKLVAGYEYSRKKEKLYTPEEGLFVYQEGKPVLAIIKGKGSWQKGEEEIISVATLSTSNTNQLYLEGESVSVKDNVGAWPGLSIGNNHIKDLKLGLETISVKNKDGRIEITFPEGNTLS